MAGLASGAANTARIRVSARPSDVLAICAELESLAGEGSLRLVQPLVGIVLAEVPGATLDRVFERAREQQWLVFVERATVAQKERIDVFGPSPDMLPLMRTLKQRFDPNGVLAPGRFVGGI